MIIDLNEYCYKCKKIIDDWETVIITRRGYSHCKCNGSDKRKCC